MDFDKDGPCSCGIQKVMYKNVFYLDATTHSEPPETYQTMSSDLLCK